MKIKQLGLILALSASALVNIAFAKDKVTYLFPAPDFLPAFAPFQLAKAKGYYSDAGLAVKFQIGKGGADVAKQVALGNVDVGGGIGDTALIVRPNGLKVRGVALLGGKSLTQLAYRQDSGIQSLADLKGKKIGVLSFKDTTYYNLLAVLAHYNISKTQTSIQALGAGGIIKLMISGDIHAMSGVPEWVAAVRGAGIPVKTVFIDSIYPAMAQAILASDETIQERPHVVAGIVQGTIKAIKDIMDNPKQASQDYVKAVSRHQGKEKQIESIMRSYIAQVYATPSHTKFGSFDPKRMKVVQDFYLKNKIIRTAIPIEDSYTNQFIE